MADTNIEFSIDYVGAVPVAASVPSQSLWAMFGPQIIQQATKKLKALNPRVTAGTLIITKNRITVLDTATGGAMDDEDLSVVKYAAIHPSDKKKVVYVIYYSQIGILYCHALGFRNKATAQAAVESIDCGVAQARSTRDEAFGFDSDFIHSMAQDKAYKAQSSEAAELASLGQTIGIIESIRYVGTVPMKMKGAAASKEISQDDVETASTFMLGQLKLHAERTPKKDRRLSFVSRKAAADADPLSGLPVVLVISSEGIRTIDNISREETHRVFLQDLAFFAAVVVKGDKDGELFAAVSKDDKLRHVRLRLYRCAAKGQAGELCDKVGEAFKAANRADELRNGRPFMPIASMTTEIQTPLMNLEFERSRVAPINPIGAGQFGLVFLVHFYGDDPTGTDAVQRAVKVLRPGASTETMVDFLREAEILQRLDHRNVIKLHGVCLRQKPWLILEEHANYGDLDGVLRACKEKEIELTEIELITLITQISDGAAYITAAGVVHSDYAARNVLLHYYNEVKIADFGWSRQLEPGKKCFNRDEIPKISTRWLAPECIEKKEFSEKTDVWALGVTMWEVFTAGSSPYAEVHFLQVARVVKEGLRLARPLNCSNECFTIIAKCWETDPKKRPKIKDFNAALGRIAVAMANDPHAESPRDIGATLLLEQSVVSGAGATGSGGGGGGADAAAAPTASPGHSHGTVTAQSQHSRPASTLSAFGDDDDGYDEYAADTASPPAPPSLPRPLSGRLLLSQSGEFDGFGEDVVIDEIAEAE